MLAGLKQRWCLWLKKMKEPIEPALLAEHLRASYVDYAFNSPVGIGISIYLYFSSQDLPSGYFLKIWMVIWVSYLLGRFLAALRYPKHELPDPVILDRWSRWLLGIQFMDSVMVSALGLYVYPQLDLLARGAVLVPALVLVSATALSLSGRWLSVLFYAPLIYGSFAWATWNLEQPYAHGLSIFIVGMFCLYLFYAVNQRKTVMKGFELAKRNGEMAQELQVKNAELQEVARARSRLLATVSHDLRQPAHAIGLLSERALMDQSPANRDQSLRDLNELSQSLSASLMTLMDLTRLDAGLVEARIMPLSLNQVFLRLAAEFSSSARNKELDLVVAPTDLWVKSDPVLLHGLLANLVSNAIKYTRHGRVEIEAVARSTQVDVRIRDTGIGIHPDKLGVIFKEFVRLDFSDAGSEGLGLGLSIVKRYGMLLGHKVSVESEPDCGSCFTASLAMAPMENDGQVEPAPNTKLATANSRLAGVNVLVIDNVDLLLTSMSRTLSDWGCSVTAARNLSEALLCARDKVFDLVISDFHLGDREPNGLELIARLRALRHDYLPAVLMTGDVSAQLEAQAQSESLRLLHKPVRPVVLQACVVSLLSRSAGGE